MIWPNQVPISVVQNKVILAFGAVARFGGWLLKQVLPTRARFGRAPARHLRVCRRADGIWARLAPAYSALYDVAATSHRSGVYGRCAAAHHQKVLPQESGRCSRTGVVVALVSPWRCQILGRATEFLVRVRRPCDCALSRHRWRQAGVRGRVSAVMGWRYECCAFGPIRRPRLRVSRETSAVGGTRLNRRWTGANGGFGSRCCT